MIAKEAWYKIAESGGEKAASHLVEALYRDVWNVDTLGQLLSIARRAPEMVRDKLEAQVPSESREGYVTKKIYQAMERPFLPYLEAMQERVNSASNWGIVDHSKLAEDALGEMTALWLGQRNLEMQHRSVEDFLSLLLQSAPRISAKFKMLESQLK